MQLLRNAVARLRCRRRNDRAEHRWRRLVTSLSKVRRLQRIFRNSGMFLQRFPRSLLDRLSKQKPS